jgi:hypothetical protein
MSEFNPNDVCVSNGNIFGFPIMENEAEIIIIPVPWDATASYKNYLWHIKRRYIWLLFLKIGTT